MQGLSRQELDIRGKALMGHQYQVDGDGRIRMERSDPRLGFFVDRMTELMHEYYLRGIAVDDYASVLATEESLVRARGDGFKRPGRAVESHVAPTTPYLVKYAEEVYVRQALSGRLRLGGARSYHDPSLNAARRDDELVHMVDWDSSVLPFGLPFTSPSFRNAPPVTRFRTETRIKTEFYVYCLSGGLRARLFNDFQADAALIIRDPIALLDRIQAAVSLQLPGAQVTAGPVEYYDPLHTTPAELRLPFWKSFAYAYQEEVRVLVTPSKGEATSDELFLDLGSLEDIAEVVTLDGS